MTKKNHLDLKTFLDGTIDDSIMQNEDEYNAEQSGHVYDFANGKEHQFIYFVCNKLNHVEINLCVTIYRTGPSRRCY